MMGLDELNSAERRSKFVTSRNLKSVIRCSGSYFVQYLLTQFISKGFVEISSLPPSLRHSLHHSITLQRSVGLQSIFRSHKTAQIFG